MEGNSVDPILSSALERGRKSVRDGTVGNPYPPDSKRYDQFERGIEIETQERAGEIDCRDSYDRLVA